MRSTLYISMLFVFLWSTAFIGLKLCAAYAEPATFVFIRAVLTAVLIRAFIGFGKLRWPERLLDVAHAAVVGILIHGIYASAIFASLYHGMDVGYSALILGMQPLITTAISIVWLKESITWMKLSGMFLGFSGVVLLVCFADDGLLSRLWKADTVTGQQNNVRGICLCFIALLAISVGLLYQKRFCTKIELLPGACIQYSAAAAFVLPIGLSLETMHIDWTWSFVFGLMWLVLAVSIGAMSALMLLIRRGEASAVSNLFYLVPPLTAIQAWFVFDEKLEIVSLISMLICMVAVMMVGYSARKNSVCVNSASEKPGHAKSNEKREYIFSRNFVFPERSEFMKKDISRYDLS